MLREFNISDSADNTNKNNQTSAPAAYNDYFAIPIQDEFDMKIKKLEDNIENLSLYNERLSVFSNGKFVGCIRKSSTRDNSRSFSSAFVLLCSKLV
jgi:hypothetical protein